MALQRWGPNWLAELLTVRFRQDLNQVMRTRVLAPMGINSGELVWRRNAYRPQTLSVGGAEVERREFGSGITTSVDVMAKFGLMLLRDGRWRSTRLTDPVTPRGRVHQSWLSECPATARPWRARCRPTWHGLLFWTNADGRRPVPKGCLQRRGPDNQLHPGDPKPRPRCGQSGPCFGRVGQPVRHRRRRAPSTR